MPLRIHVSAYPLHDQTTLRLFLGKWWSSPLRIHASTLFREAPFKVAGYSAVTPLYSTPLHLSPMHPQVKFYVYGQELIIPLASMDEMEDSGDDGYTTEVVRRILAAKDQGLVSDKAYHELRMALPEVIQAESRLSLQYCKKGKDRI